MASVSNYPGGNAFARMHSEFRCPPESLFGRKAKVHIGNIAAISGVTRFGEQPACYQYSKAENLTNPSDFETFDILLAEPELPFKLPASFRLVFRQEGFSHVDFMRWSVITKPSVDVFAKDRLLDRVN